MLSRLNKGIFRFEKHLRVSVPTIRDNFLRVSWNFVSGTSTSCSSRINMGLEDTLVYPCVKFEVNQKLEMTKINSICELESNSNLSEDSELNRSIDSVKCLSDLSLISHKEADRFVVTNSSYRWNQDGDYHNVDEEEVTFGSDMPVCKMLVKTDEIDRLTAELNRITDYKIPPIEYVDVVPCPPRDPLIFNVQNTIDMLSGGSGRRFFSDNDKEFLYDHSKNVRELELLDYFYDPRLRCPTESIRVNTYENNCTKRHFRSMYRLSGIADKIDYCTDEIKKGDDIKSSFRKEIMQSMKFSKDVKVVYKYFSNTLEITGESVAMFRVFCTLDIYYFIVSPPDTPPPP